jgi:hypothetical protein
MEIHVKETPRKFMVGLKKLIAISDCGYAKLKPDEQITLKTNSNKGYDITAKEWGFYATPSLNARLIDYGFKSAMVRNRFGKYYIMLVEINKLDCFFRYISDEKLEILEWLDER